MFTRIYTFHNARLIGPQIPIDVHIFQVGSFKMKYVDKIAESRIKRLNFYFENEIAYVVN